MNQSTALKVCLEHVACPQCQSRVILTKEKILFCPTCCVGYPLIGEIPDFREAHAIDFKKSVDTARLGAVVTLSIQGGKTANQNHEIKKQHAIVFGRAVRLDLDSDITYVGLNETAPIPLHHHSQQLIEKFLLHSSFGEAGVQAAQNIPYSLHQFLGGFHRDADVLLDDKSVSRAHAIFYRDDENLWVLDLLSKNGTYVNGHEVERTKLKHGDMVSVGTVGVKVQLR